MAVAFIIIKIKCKYLLRTWALHTAQKRSPKSKPTFSAAGGRKMTESKWSLGLNRLRPEAKGLYSKYQVTKGNVL